MVGVDVLYDKISFYIITKLLYINCERNAVADTIVHHVPNIESMYKTFNYFSEMVAYFYVLYTHLNKEPNNGPNNLYFLSLGQIFLTYQSLEI